MSSPTLTKAEKPKVILHYVTETEGGERAIAAITCQAGGGTVSLERGVYTGTIERNLPNNVRIHPSLIELQKEGVVRVVFWRLEFLDQEDNVLLVREPGYKAVKESLPDNWWK